MKQILELQQSIALNFIKKYGSDPLSRLANNVYHNIISEDHTKLLEFDNTLFNEYSIKYWTQILTYKEIKKLSQDAIQIDSYTESFNIEIIKDLCKTISRSPYEDLIFRLPSNRPAPLCITKFTKEKHIVTAYLAPTSTSPISYYKVDDPQFYLPVEHDIIDTNCDTKNRINGLVIPDNIELLNEKSIISTIYAVNRFEGLNQGILALCLNCHRFVPLDNFMSNIYFNTKDMDWDHRYYGFNYNWLKSNHYGCRCSCPCQMCLKYRDRIHKGEIFTRLHRQRMLGKQYARMTTGKDFGD